MARPLRIEYEGAVYHVTSRGNAGEPVFRNEEDRGNILTTIKKVRDRYNWLCHGYCLMDNHYHLIIETPEGNLSNGMRQLNGLYTQGVNKRHERAGIVRRPDEWKWSSYRVTAGLRKPHPCLTAD